MYQGQLYQAGYGGIARLEGGVWQQLEVPNLAVPVRSLTSFGNQLFSDQHVFDGSTWTRLTNFRSANGFTTWNGNLVKGGSGVSQWNGASFERLDPFFSLYINAVASYNGSLYAGGSFVYSGPPAAYGIVRWNGSNWGTLTSNSARTSTRWSCSTTGW